MNTLASEIHFLLFINPKSGNGNGRSFLTLGYPELLIRYEGSARAHLYFIDLFSEASRRQGLELIKNFTLSNSEFRVIICGGDGTIPWVLAEISNEGISLARIVFGIIPVGTGNDFSRSLGWGTDTVPISKGKYQDLSHLVKKWMKARVGTYDMWDVTVETFPNGQIYDIKDQQ